MIIFGNFTLFHWYSSIGRGFLRIGSLAKFAVHGILFASMFTAFSLPAMAQEPAIFALCSEGESPRICGYDPNTPGPPVAVYPILSNSTSRISISSGKLATAVNVAENGFIVATDIFLSDVDGSNVSLFVRIPLGTSTIRDIALSPDLQRLAYVESDKIKVYDKRSNITNEIVSERVAFGFDGGIKWSPDGKSIVYSKNVAVGIGNQLIAMATVPADGSDLPSVITDPASRGGTDNPVLDIDPDWSPDGESIVFVREFGFGSSRTVTIYTVPVQGGTLATVFSPSWELTGNVSGPEWSEDGETIAFMGGNPVLEEAGIFTVPAEGGVPARLSTEMNGQGQTWATKLIEWQGASKELIVNDTRDLEDADPSDDICDADDNVPKNQCTLRAAIQTAELVEDPDSISFDIDGEGIHTINITRPLPLITDELVIDATTEEDYEGTPLIQLRGSSAVGLNIQAKESTVRGLSIGGFSTAGIQISGEGSVSIQRNYLGVSANGSTAVPNGNGIRIVGSPDNKIGGDEPEFRNVISGNTGDGVIISGEEATGNVISGNRIGTNARGTSALANGDDGIRITESPGNRIGGEEPSTRNIISGNGGAGVVVEGAESSGNVITGNYIGTDLEGTTAIPNEAEGVLINGAPQTSIGTEDLGNVIAGNGSLGVLVNGHLTDGESNGTLILNNFIGLDASGEVPMFNGGEAVIRLNGAVRQAKVGQAGAGNVIAGTGDMAGVELLDLGEETGAPDGTQVSANYIGVTKSGKKMEENLLFGVVMSTESGVGGGTPGVVGGEDVASGNRIHGALAGILIEGERSSNSVVAFNVIGNMEDELPADERDPLGIWINGANQIQVISNTVGGQSAGIVLGSNESTLMLNKIGTNEAGSLARPNSIGLWIPGEVGSSDFSTGDGNIIGNQTGINLISGNEIGVLVGGSFNPFPAGKGVAGKDAIKSDLRDKFIGQSTEFRSLTSLTERPPDSVITKLTSKKAALKETDDNGEPDNNVFRLNRIGTNLAGDKEIGNGRSGSEDEAGVAVRIEGGTNNRLIGNLISGNGGGVYVGPDSDFETEPVNTLLAGNIIGGSLASEFANIPNQFGGVIVINTAGTRLLALPVTDGGDPAGNIIRGNGNGGVQIGIIDSDDVGNQVRQSSFFDNKGPSIVLLNRDLEYPSMAPQVPEILAAAALPGDASLAFKSQTTGIVDGFISKECEEGRAQGEYAFSLNVEPGTSVVELPYDQLKSNSEDATSLYMALTITAAGDAGTTSEFSDCYRIARESDIDSTAFSINDEGELINGAGIKVDVNSSSEKQSTQAGQESGSNLSDEGMLYVTRYRVNPVDSPIDGAAESADGSMVTPDMASEDRYWSLQSTGIDSISYRVCLDIEGLPGADVPEQLVVLHRRSASQSWKPYDSTLEDGQLCADGLTRFGEIGIGGSGDVNYLPVDPVVFDLPTEFELKSNYPNPFNPSTVIPFSLPEATHVKLEVYDMAGRRIAILIDEMTSAGQHQTSFSAGDLASGLYMIRIKAGRFTATQKMMLIK